MAVSGKSVEIRVKCWVEMNGVKFFGPGRADLLERILEHGSIAKAAQTMGMSYKKAWAMVDEMNAMAKTPFVITTKGGTKGGGTEVTAAGKKAIAAYQKISQKILAVVKSEKALLEL
jgi:molybdate transport system regulatory protein